ncbi:MAG: LPS export ABC transporter periplasmic protein LptC [Bdellovibrionaceae bacterium]|nr:LPS export ABC transporter periplasmic protein LptC [Pseudobdellovibrionaceae bacterium]
MIIIAPQLLDQEDFKESQNEFNFQDQGPVEQRLTGMHLIESRQQEKEWELWSNEAKNYKNKRIWDLETVKVKFFGKNGVVFNVTGKKGKVEVISKNMEVEGEVVTKTSNGYIFRTEKIKYNSKEKTLIGPEDIEMLGPLDANKQRMNLRGTHLIANLDSALMEIKSNVVAEKPIKNEIKVYIKSQRAQFSGRSNYARFLDDVVIDYDTMRVTGPDAVFNYDSGKDIISSIFVQGGVKVSDVDKWATSQTVNVEFDKEQYIFKGNPRVVQNNDELKGEEIIFFDRGKRVKVLKARANLNENKSRVKK